MGKKNRKKQDDGDYFASLGAPTENAVDDAAAEKAEEERLARQAKAAAQREAKKQKEAQERAERAAVAERARLAMERRNNKGKSVAVVEEAEEEEAVEEPAPAPQPTAAGPYPTGTTEAGTSSRSGRPSRRYTAVAPHSMSIRFLAARGPILRRCLKSSTGKPVP